MDTSIFFGGSVVAAFVAGMVALAAPCCVSVMLPAYFASAFQNRRLLVVMTFLFAAGVATVVLPIAMGAAALRRLITEQHTAIYLAAGSLMLVLAAYTLLGGKLRIPVPGGGGRGRGGPLSVYSLGVFSGIATSCCAPVLAGVIALAGVASSFGLALGLGAAYVFGMVAPLFVMSLLWERFDWRASRLFKPRSVTYRLGPLRRTVSASALASGLLLMVMGVAVAWIGLARDSMPSGSGWQAHLSATLQHWGHELTRALDWVPGWAAAVVLVALAVFLARAAFRQALRTDRHPPPGKLEPESSGVEVQEHEHEYA